MNEVTKYTTVCTRPTDETPRIELLRTLSNLRVSKSGGGALTGQYEAAISAVLASVVADYGSFTAVLPEQVIK